MLQLTTEQALNVILQAAQLAKLTKQEHMTVEEAYKILSDKLKKEDKKDQGVETSS